VIKNPKVRITFDGRGNISSGEKTEGGLPRSLDHFNVSHFEELVKAYGEKPTALILYVPSDEITDFFDHNYIRWIGADKGKPTKVRQCDGEECFHRLEETIEAHHYVAGEVTPCVCKELDIPDGHKMKCRYSCYFSAWVANPSTGRVENPACYRFVTGSHNSGEAILSELEKIRSLNQGVIRNIPFRLSVRMVSGEKPSQRFPIWSLQAMGLMSQIQEWTEGLVGGDNRLKLEAHVNLTGEAIDEEPSDTIPLEPKKPTATSEKAVEVSRKEAPTNALTVTYEEVMEALQSAAQQNSLEALRFWKHNYLRVLEALPREQQKALQISYDKIIQQFRQKA